MSVIYIREQGAYVHKSGERIVVTKNSDKILEMPLIHIESIAVFGNVQISTQVLTMFMENGIDISYFSFSGKYLGHIVSENSKNIFLRMKQNSIYQEEAKRIAIAKKIVWNKIDNQISLIENYRWKDKEHDWKKQAKQLKQLQESLKERETINEILGIEGICSNIYFDNFAKMFKGDLKFEGRNRRPPKDPINIILSLAYTMLTKEIGNIVDAEGFESYLGFLHEVRYGRKSLALDLVEEFRQPIVDRLVLVLFNKNMITKYEFEYLEDGSITLNENGLKKFYTEYERWINGTNTISGVESFRKCIQEQVASLKRAILKEEEYIPYNWRNKECM